MAARNRVRRNFAVLWAIKIGCFGREYISSLRAFAFWERCGECVIDISNQFFEAAITVAQVIGDNLAVSADHE